MHAAPQIHQLVGVTGTAGFRQLATADGGQRIGSRPHLMHGMAGNATGRRQLIAVAGAYGRRCRAAVATRRCLGRSGGRVHRRRRCSRRSRPPASPRRLAVTACAWGAIAGSLGAAAPLAESVGGVAVASVGGAGTAAHPPQRRPVSQRRRSGLLPAAQRLSAARRTFSDADREHCSRTCPTVSSGASGRILLHVLAIGMAVAAEVRDVGRRVDLAETDFDRVGRTQIGGRRVSAMTVLAAESLLPVNVAGQVRRRNKQVPRVGVPNLLRAMALDAHVVCRRLVLGSRHTSSHESHTHHDDGHRQSQVWSHSNGSQPSALSGRKSPRTGPRRRECRRTRGSRQWAIRVCYNSGRGTTAGVLIDRSFSIRQTRPGQGQARVRRSFLRRLSSSVPAASANRRDPGVCGTPRRCSSAAPSRSYLGPVLPVPWSGSSLAQKGLAASSCLLPGP